MKRAQLALFDSYFQGRVPVRVVGKRNGLIVLRCTRKHRGFKRGEEIEALPQDVLPRYNMKIPG